MRWWPPVLTVLAMVVGGMATLAGPAAADGPPGDGDGSRLHAGDLATYAVEVTDADGVHSFAMTVNVTGAGLTRARDGDLHLAVRTVWRLVDDQGQREREVLLDPGTLQVLAYGAWTQGVRDMGAAYPPSFGLLPPATEDVTERSARFPDGMVVCPFAAAGVPCTLAPYWVDATGQGAGHYPAAIEVTGQDLAARLTLTSLVRGEGALPLVDDWADRQALPAVAFAPPQPWGLELADTTQPFPLDQAYEAALTHEDGAWLRAWVAANPEHIALKAASWWMIDLNHRERHWTFVLQSPDDAVAFTIKRFEAATIAQSMPLVEGQPLFFQLEQADPIDRFGGPLPAWGAVPTAWPTVASLQERWRALAFPDGRDLPLSLTAFSWSCPAGGDCGEPSLWVILVHDSYTRTLPGLNGGTTSRYHTSWSNLAFDESGGLAAFYEGIESTGAAALVEGLPTAPAAGGDLEESSRAAWGWTPIATGAAGVVGLAALVAAAWAVLKWTPLATAFSRVTGPTLLEHPARAALVREVTARPGIHFQAIVRASGLSNGAVVHHLRKLVDGGFVVERRGPGSACYFPAHTPRALREVAPSLRSDGSRRVLAVVASEPGLSLRDLGRRCGLSAATVHHHVGRLRAAGLLDGAAMAPSALGSEALREFAAVAPADALAEAVPA